MKTGTLPRDLLGGLTVALVGLPQCLAYAMMAGLPPAYGLATAAVPGLVAALLGASPQVITGPTNTTGLLILVALTPYLDASGVLATSALPVLATLTLLAGAIRLVALLVGGASLIDFLPESVLVGFTAGAGVLIAAMQLDEALGMSSLRAPNLAALVAAWWDSLRAGARPAVGATIVSLATTASITLGQRWRPTWPVALVVVLAASAAAAGFGLDAGAGIPLVGDRSAVPDGWPPGAVPTFDPDVLVGLLTPAAAIALVGTLELTVTARAGGARPDMRRELGAQGLANVAGAFTSSFPASASLTRSALLRLGGARTRLAAFVAALTVIPILLFGSDLLGAIPLASLAGVLMVIAGRMIDIGRIRRMWAAGGTTRVLLTATLVGTLVLPLSWAILGGAGLALLIHLARTRRPRIEALVHADRLRPPHEDESPDHVVLEVSGDLHFAATRHFREAASQAIPPSVRHVVIDLTHAHEVRFAALMALESLVSDLADQHVTVVLAGVSQQLGDMLERAGSKLPVVHYEPTPGASAIRALERAKATAAEARSPKRESSSGPGELP